MVAGTRAFEARTGVDTMHTILNLDPPDFAATRLPVTSTTIVRRCLEKRPEQRFQSSADLAFAAPRTARKPWLWAAAAILAAVALVALGFAVRDRTLHRASSSFQRITFRNGFVTTPRFTPCGPTLYLALRQDGRPHEAMVCPTGVIDGSARAICMLRRMGGHTPITM